MTELRQRLLACLAHALRLRADILMLPALFDETIAGDPVKLEAAREAARVQAQREYDEAAKHCPADVREIHL